MPDAVSSSVSPSSVMEPLSGRNNPAIMVTIEVLPAPEWPNNAVTPPTLSKLASIVVAPNALRTSTRSISLSALSEHGATCKPFGREERGKCDQDGDHDQLQCREVAIRCLDQRVDCRRDGLRLAGNVGNER